MPSKRHSGSKEPPWLSMDDLLALVAEEKHGQPNYGAILKYFRVQMGWKGWQLAQCCSEALGEEGLEEETKLITQNWISMMESQNMVPKDEKRRWILATLLEIPPVLFGLEALPSTPSPLIWQPVEVAEYRASLERYCRLLHLGTPHQVLRHIHRRINNLNNTFRLATHPQEKSEMLKLLCEYYILAGQITDRRLGPDEALRLLSNAIAIAREQHFYDLWAYALRQRGYVYLERGGITAMRVGFAEAQPDFEAAKRAVDEARSLERYLSPQWYSAILLIAGKVEGQFARNGQELKQGLKLIDRASKQVGQPLSGISLVLDEERYHLDKAAVSITSPLRAARSPETARQALQDAEKAARFVSKTRQAQRATFWAQSYFVEELYPVATTLAEQALSIGQNIDSPMHMAHVKALYTALRASPYGKDAEVARLGIKLLRVQQPALFE